jgi:hypothetical protein
MGKIFLIYEEEFNPTRSHAYQGEMNKNYRPVVSLMHSSYENISIQSKIIFFNDKLLHYS